MGISIFNRPVHPKLTSTDVEFGGIGRPFPASEVSSLIEEFSAEFKTAKIILPWMVFVSKQDQQRFDQFTESEMQLKTLLIILFVLCLVAVNGAAAAFVAQMSSFHMLARVFRLGLILVGGTYLYSVRNGGIAILNRKIDSVSLGNIAIIYQAVSSGWILISRVMIGSCNGVDHSLCNPSMGQNLLPVDSLLAVLFVVGVAAIVCKAHRWWAVVLAFAITLAAAILGIVIGKLYSVSHIHALVILIFMAVITHEHDLNYIKAYLGLVNLEASLRSKITAENEKEMIKMQSTEMRHLIGNVAHDLKTPVQGFMMELENLAAATSITSKRACVRSLRATCAFMTMTINRAIDFTKANSGMSLVPSMETVDVQGVIGWAKNCVGKSPLGVPVVMDPFDDRMCNFVITDKQWLMENLLCLLANAMKFSIEGSIVIKCKYLAAFDQSSRHWMAESLKSFNRPHQTNISPKSSKKVIWRSGGLSTDTASEVSNESSAMLRFEVVDCGVGVPKIERESLFQPFQQAQRRAGGTGLGLYSLSKRIEAIGGEYGVCDRQDGTSGSCFWFTIPYRADHSIDLEQGLEVEKLQDIGHDDMHSPRHATPIRQFSSGDIIPYDSIDSYSRPIEAPPGNIAGNRATAATRILIVDDSIPIQKTTARALSRAGYIVDVATNGAHCLKKLREEPLPYGVILMDLQMPVLDGIETVKRIRLQELNTNGDNKKRDIGHQFIIGVSANSDSGTQDEALAAGMDAFISKPLTLQQLRDCCKRAKYVLQSG